MQTIWIVLLLALSFQASAEIYKWVDDQGITHYGEKAPDNKKAKIIQLHTDETPGEVPGKLTEQPADSSSRLEKQKKLTRALSDDRKEKQEQRELKQRMETQRIRNCAVSKDNLRRYESSSSVYKVDDQGNRIILPGGERDKSIQRARAEVKKWCGN